MTNLDSVLLKSKDITLETKVCIVKAMMFRNINNLRYADDTTHDRKQKGTEEPLDESERGK